MSTTSAGESALGDFFSDALKNYTSADVSIINPYSIRTNWAPGYICFI